VFLSISVIDLLRIGTDPDQRIRTTEFTDPDSVPDLFICDLKMPVKIVIFSKFFCLLLFEGIFHQSSKIKPS
jgi:hypothetical protein